MARAELAPVIRKESLPMAHVPLPHERGAVRNLGVAGHELNHALVAYALGIPLLSISTIAEGDSLGRTMFGGEFSAHELKIIAAAGSVPTVFGAADGFGHDLYQAHVAEYYYGGITVGEAQSRAASLVNSFSSRVRQKAAEIIAYLEYVPGGSFAQLLNRAEIEVQMEEGKTDFFVQRFEEQEEEKIEKATTIELLGDHSQRIIRAEIKNNVVIEKEICTVCLGENGHFPDCPVVKEQKEEKGIPRIGSIYVKPLKEKLAA